MGDSLFVGDTARLTSRLAEWRARRSSATRCGGWFERRFNRMLSLAELGAFVIESANDLGSEAAELTASS